MADKSDIGWTGATEIVDRGGNRVRLYFPQDPSRPGTQLRKKMGDAGFRWCRECRGWLPAAAIKSGLCFPHIREDDRARYATDANYRNRRQDKSAQRRGVEAIPLHAQDSLTELFDGKCAYCPSDASTWDHVIAVAKGGKTVPGNTLPACKPCNSSKRDHDLDEWLAATGRELSCRAVEHLSLHGGLDG